MIPSSCLSILPHLNSKIHHYDHPLPNIFNSLALLPSIPYHIHLEKTHSWLNQINHVQIQIEQLGNTDENHMTWPTVPHFKFSSLSSNPPPFPYIITFKLNISHLASLSFNLPHPYPHFSFSNAGILYIIEKGKASIRQDFPPHHQTYHLTCFCSYLRPLPLLVHWIPSSLTFTRTSVLHFFLSSAPCFSLFIESCPSTKKYALYLSSLKKNIL